MKVKVLFNTVEFCQTTLGKAPEIFYAVNMNTVAFREFVVAMVDSEMLVITDIY